LTGGKKGDDDDEEADERWKPLISMGIQVILIPDSAVFALMSRVNKVILAPHTVLANGGLIAATGALTIAQAAKVHQTPVVVVSGVYKLSPVYPFDMEELVEYGDPGKVIQFQQGDLVENVDVSNPIYDYVSADLVDLYITNL
jgi:translation initiation factor eIF-2B subunit beta